MFQTLTLSFLAVFLTRCQLGLEASTVPLGRGGESGDEDEDSGLSGGQLRHCLLVEQSITLFLSRQVGRAVPTL